MLQEHTGPMLQIMHTTGNPGKTAGASTALAAMLQDKLKSSTSLQWHAAALCGKWFSLSYSLDMTTQDGTQGGSTRPEDASHQNGQACLADLRILRLSASVTLGPSDVPSPLASAWALAFFARGVESLSADPCMPGL